MEELSDAEINGVEGTKGPENSRDDEIYNINALQASVNTVEEADGWVLKRHRPSSIIALYQARKGTFLVP